MFTSRPKYKTILGLDLDYAAVNYSLTNTVFYANPNKASLKFVKPELAKDPAVFPDEAALAKMIPPGTPDQATRKLITRTFTNFKSGR